MSSFSASVTFDESSRHTSPTITGPALTSRLRRTLRMGGLSSPPRSARSSRFPKSVVCITATSGGQRNLRTASPRRLLPSSLRIVLGVSEILSARPAPGAADCGLCTSLRRLEPQTRTDVHQASRTRFWRRTGRLTQRPLPTFMSEAEPTHRALSSACSAWCRNGLPGVYPGRLNQLA